VALDKYDQTVCSNIATVYTFMNTGPIMMFLKKRKNGKYFALLTSKSEMTSGTAMPTYTKRWRIENFFKDNDFLGMDKLPSLNLNSIHTVLSLRLLAFHTLDNFRHDLGPEYKSKIYFSKCVNTEKYPGIVINFIFKTLLDTYFKLRA